MNLWMGNRIGETSALRLKCIDWENGGVTVPESLFEGKSNKPKTKAGERAVVLIEAQLAELKKYKQKHFPKRDRTIGYFLENATVPSTRGGS